jgi:hypothetical protein
MLQRGPSEQPAHQFGIAGLQVQCHIRGHLQFPADQVGSAGLANVPQDPVQHKPSGFLGSDHRLPQHVEDDLVGNEFAAIEIRLNGQAETGPPRDVIAQQVTSRDVGNAGRSRSCLTPYRIRRVLPGLLHHPA